MRVMLLWLIANWSINDAAVRTRGARCHPSRGGPCQARSGRKPTFGAQLGPERVPGGAHVQVGRRRVPPAPDDGAVARAAGARGDLRGCGA